MANCDRIHEGDVVSRRSYGQDLLFRVVKVDCYGQSDATATLKGISARLLADAPVSDLVLADERALVEQKRRALRESAEHLRSVRVRRIAEEQVRHRRDRRRTRGVSIADDLFDVPGKVLHLDGDADYLRDCMKFYKELGVPVVGKHVAAEEQPKAISDLLREHTPDVLVLTGHDALKKKGAERTSIDSYWNSGFYVGAVRHARQYEMDKDGLVIIAGACQSYYEALIEAGANYASSPDRVLIHCLDPVLLAEKVVNTPIEEIVRVDEAIESTITKRPGVGGLQTRGKMRISLPRTAVGVFGAGVEG
ncbi:MAG: sporulation peptidase YabG [Clostridia bacterium]|nr:sporulation peptidase YabG [Clostridia bacterium]